MAPIAGKMTRKPKLGSWEDFSHSRLRAPRKNQKGKDDSPLEQAAGGIVSVFLGMAAIGWASRSMARVANEKAIIGKMWAQKTTVASLMRASKASCNQGALPETVLLRGRLGATGAPVKAITPHIKQLRKLAGQIDQPSNELIEIGQKFKKNIKDESKLRAGFGRLLVRGMH